MIVSRGISTIIAVMIYQGTAKWTPEGLDRELYPIAHLESSFGKNMNHQPHSRGEYWSSIGALGLKPVTAHEEYLKSKRLREKYPGLESKEAFTKEIQHNQALYNEAASTHWRRLRSVFPDINRAIYAWRWGRTASANADVEQVTSDSYVTAYHTVQERINAHSRSR